MRNAAQRLEDLFSLVRAVGVDNLPKADKDFFYTEGARLLKTMTKEDIDSMGDCP